MSNYSFALLGSVVLLSACATNTGGRHYTLAKVDRYSSLVPARSLLDEEEGDAIGDGLDELVDGYFGITLDSGYIRYLQSIVQPEIAIFSKVAVRKPEEVGEDAGFVFQNVYLASESDGSNMELYKDSSFPRSDIEILPPFEYNGEIITVQLRVIEVDSDDNERVKHLIKLISLAATTAAVGLPESAAAISVFQSVLTFLTENNSDDIEFAYDFQLSSASNDLVVERNYLEDMVLQPRLGTYVVIKTEHPDRVRMPDSLLGLLGESALWVVSKVVKVATLNLFNWTIFGEPQGDRYNRLFGRPFTIETGSWQLPEATDGWFIANRSYVGADGYSLNPFSSENPRYLVLENKTLKTYASEIPEDQHVPRELELVQEKIAAVSWQIDVLRQKIVAEQGQLDNLANKKKVSFQQGIDKKQEQLNAREEERDNLRSGEMELVEGLKESSTTQHYREQSYVVFSITDQASGISYQQLEAIAAVDTSVDDLKIRTTQATPEEWKSSLEKVQHSAIRYIVEENAQKAKGKVARAKTEADKQAAAAEYEAYIGSLEELGILDSQDNVGRQELEEIRRTAGLLDIELNRSAANIPLEDNALLLTVPDNLDVLSVAVRKIGEDLNSITAFTLAEDGAITADYPALFGQTGGQGAAQTGVAPGMYEVLVVAGGRTTALPLTVDLEATLADPTNSMGVIQVSGKNWTYAQSIRIELSRTVDGATTYTEIIRGVADLEADDDGLFTLSYTDEELADYVITAVRLTLLKGMADANWPTQAEGEAQQEEI
jgi:hypothetical protein